MTSAARSTLRRVPSRRVRAPAKARPKDAPLTLEQVTHVLNGVRAAVAELKSVPVPLDRERTFEVDTGWRAIHAAPDEVARHCDWPVNEADLHARHRWLVGQAAFREKMFADPDFYDARVAGWWVWGLSQWIGGGWCHVAGPKVWSRYSGSRPDLDGIGQGVHKKMPDLYTRGDGRGVRAASPEKGGGASEARQAAHA